MSKRSALIENLKKEIGTTENPKNSNIVKFNQWYYDPEALKASERFVKIAKWYHSLVQKGDYLTLGRTFAWCGSFVAYMNHFSGIYLEPELHLSLGYVPNAQNYLMAKGYETKTPQPGDIVVFDWNNDGFEEHIGFFLRFEGNKVITIEGNTSPDSKGSQSNGGMVCQKIRKMKQIEGFYNVIDDER